VFSIYCLLFLARVIHWWEFCISVCGKIWPSFLRGIAHVCVCVCVCVSAFWYGSCNFVTWHDVELILHLHPCFHNHWHAISLCLETASRLFHIDANIHCECIHWMSCRPYLHLSLRVHTLNGKCADIPAEITVSGLFTEFTVHKVGLYTILINKVLMLWLTLSM